jgi:hypothetical protein
VETSFFYHGEKEKAQWNFTGTMAQRMQRFLRKILCGDCTQWTEPKSEVEILFFATNATNFTNDFPES